MIHVLHVISSLSTGSGGPTAALHGLAQAQAKLGLSVSVITTALGQEADQSAERLRQHGVAVHIVGPCKGRLVRHPMLEQTVAHLVSTSDVVHIHALWEEIQHLAAVCCRRMGKPYIIRPCGMLDPWSLGQSRWVKRLYMAFRLRNDLNRARAIHFTAQAEYELTKALRLQSPPIVEPNGVSLVEFESLPLRGAFRSKYKQLENKRILLFLSRLHPKKGLELLLPAFAGLNMPEVTLVIAGPDAHGYQAKLEQLVESLGIKDQVLFTGMLEGRARIEAFVDAEFFVLPSYQENFGISVVEALASGCPVVISDQVNIHDQITTAGVGGVVQNHIEDISKAIEFWLKHDKLRNCAAEKTRAFVWQHYDWGQIAARWLAHYKKMLQTP